MAATAFRTFCVPSLGVATTDHKCPSHRSTSVDVGASAGPNAPTAHTSFPETAATPRSWFPSGSGSTLGTTSQLAVQEGDGDAEGDADGDAACSPPPVVLAASNANSTPAVSTAATTPFRMARRWFGSTPERRYPGHDRSEAPLTPGE